MHSYRLFSANVTHVHEVSSPAQGFFLGNDFGNGFVSEGSDLLSEVFVSRWGALGRQGSWVHNKGVMQHHASSTGSSNVLFSECFLEGFLEGALSGLQ